ncbi:MAG: MFS transporter [Muribaculaceae bacterium]|nr:MFS transporter [Muribaculaceae bacterium]
MGFSSQGVKSGKGTYVGWLALIDLYIIWIITSIPGLAIAPVMPMLLKVFPGTTELETQMLTVAPNIAAIPFTLLGGALATRWNNMKMLYWVCLFYVIAAAALWVAPNMIVLIILSFVIGIGAGIVSPLASVFVADMFAGKQRQQQYGNASAMVNVGLMIGVIATGYLAKIDWRLPFVIYLLPLFPLLFSGTIKKYIKEPKDRHDASAAIGMNRTPSPHKSVSYSQSVNIPALIKYCIFYFVITMVIGAISNYIPYLVGSSVTSGYLQAVLFFGIMISGFALNWVMRWLKHGTYVVTLLAMAVGFLLIFVTSMPVIIGAGIFIACFFYGVAQPYVENKCVAISTPAAAVISLAIYSTMDSLGNVLNPFFFKYTGMLFGHTPLPDSNQAFPFVCSLIVLLLCAVVVAIYKTYTGIRTREGHPVDNLPPIYREAMKNGTYNQLLASQHGIETPSTQDNLSPLQKAEATLEEAKKNLDSGLSDISSTIAAEKAKINEVEEDILLAEVNEQNAAIKVKAAADLAAADAVTASRHAEAAAEAAADADAIAPPEPAAGGAPTSVGSDTKK